MGSWQARPWPSTSSPRLFQCRKPTNMQQRAAAWAALLLLASAASLAAAQTDGEVQVSQVLAASHASMPAGAHAIAAIFSRNGRSKHHQLKLVPGRRRGDRTAHGACGCSGSGSLIVAAGPARTNTPTAHPPALHLPALLCSSCPPLQVPGYNCPAACVLPNCKCASHGIPGGLSPGETPQFVVLVRSGAFLGWECVACGWSA